MDRAPFRILSAALAVMLGLGDAVAQVASERVIVIDMLDNGSGTQPVDAPANDVRQYIVPWWTASGTKRSTPVEAAGLELAPGASLSQPIAAFAPLAERLLISGVVEGRGLVRLTDGLGQSLELEVSDQQFELSAAEFALRFGSAPQPRFQLELSAPADSSGAVFRDMRALAAWPCPERTVLASELRGLCDGVIRTWLERGSDRDGERATAFVPRRFAVLTGEKIDSGAGCIHPLFAGLLELCAISNEPTWDAALNNYLNDFFELLLLTRFKH
jgi:hypothetical protein